MQKKIVAAVCAAALALAMPAAAFAGTTEWAQAEKDSTNPSMAVATFTEKVKGENATLSNLIVKGKASAINSVEATAVNNSGIMVASSAQIARGVQAFDIQPYKWNKEKGSLGYKYASIEGTIEFEESVLEALPSTVALDNLYIQVYATTQDGTAFAMSGQKKMTQLAAQDSTGEITSSAVAADTATTFKFTNEEAEKVGKITAVISNGPLSINPSIVSGVNTVDDLNKSAGDASKSPKTGEIA